MSGADKRDESPGNSEEDSLLANKDIREQPTKKFSVRRIAEIYEEGGIIPDMSKIIRRDPHRRRKMLFITITILLVLLAASLAGFFLFNTSRNRFTGDRVEVTVRGPQNVASGDDVTLSVTIRNGEHIALKNGELTLLYPTNFRFSSASADPTNELSNVWQIETLSPGASTTVDITGSLIGVVGDEKLFSVGFVYVPEGLSTEFEKSVNFSAAINSSILNVELEAPLRVGVGKEVTFTVKYRNDADKSLERIRINATYPEGFSFISASPEPSEGSGIWELERLDSGGKGEITIKGTLTGEGGENREFKVQAGILEEDNAFRLQGEASALILLLKPELSLILTASGSQSGGVASLGDLVSYTVAYTNNGDVEVQDVAISLKLDSSVLDWEHRIDTQKGTIDGTTITWTKDQMSALAAVKPGEGSEITFSVPLVDALRTEEIKKNLSVTAVAKAASKKVTDLEGQQIETESNTTVTKLKTDFTFRAEARYYNDEFLQVGYGPLPPVVGQKTTYRMYWDLSNTTNEVNGVTVTTTLPSYVTWAGTTTVSAGEQLVFDASARTVTWKINRIPVGAGSLFPELEAYFDVTVTPTPDDIGKVIQLSEKAQATGTDTYTDEKLTLTKELLTTQLDSDPNAKGKGIVEPAS